MSKRSKLSRNRDPNDVARFDPDLVRLRPLVVSTPVTNNILQEIEDLRTWHPDNQYRPLWSNNLEPVRINIPPPQGKSRVQQTRARLQFQPQTPALGEALVCARRRVRREVLHALNRTKRGRGGSRKRNWRSDIKC